MGKGSQVEEEVSGCLKIAEGSTKKFLYQISFHEGVPARIGQPLISLAYGEGKYHITKTVRNLAYRFAFGVAAICAVILFLLRGNAAYLFGTSETVAVRVAQILPIFIVGFVFVSVSRVTTAYFYAMGKNLWAYVLIYGEPLTLCVLLLILPNAMGSVDGTWISVPLSQIIAMLISVLLIRKNRIHEQQFADSDVLPQG